MNEVLKRIECCICLTPLVDDGSLTQRSGDDVAVLRCGHMFHFTCVMQQLEHKNACPLCREEVQKAAGDDSNDDAYLVKLALNITTSSSSSVADRDARTADSYQAWLEEQCSELREKQRVLSGRVTALQATEQELKDQRAIVANAVSSLKQQIAVLEGTVASTASLAALRLAAAEARQALDQLNVDIAVAIREGESIEEKIAKAKRKRARRQ